MKIRYLPNQPHCFAFGGFEIQMLTAYNEIRNLGANIEKLDVWDRNADFDILHCWGLGIPNYENVYWARKAGKKVVVTSLHRYYETNKEKIRYFLSRLFYKQRLNREMMNNIDIIVVVNEKQAEVCFEYFNIPKSKVKIVPNIVNNKFFDLRQKVLSSNQNQGYILCVGNICRRKNQLKLAQSCLEIGVPLVLIGKVLPGEVEYASNLNSIIRKSNKINWVNGLPENSDLLLEYFTNCAAVALPSFMEQQPISLLEGAVLNKPLVIANQAYAMQKYYSNSKVVEPNSIQSIKSGLNEILANPTKYYPDFTPLLECKGVNVANTYLTIYQNLYNNRR